MESSEKNPVISQEDVGQRHLSRGLMACVQASNVTIEKSGIGLVFAEENASLQAVGGVIQGVGNVMRVHGSAAILQGAGNKLQVDGGVAVLQGAGNTIKVNGGLALLQGAVSTQLNQGCIGVLICGKATINERGRVLLTTPQATALGSGLRTGVRSGEPLVAREKPQEGLKREAERTRFTATSN